MNPSELLIVQRDINSPPGGWKYTVPQTGVTITAPFYSSLLPRVVKHLKANGLEVDEDVIMDGACRETKPPSNWCCPKPEKPLADMPIPLLSGVEAFLKSVWGVLKMRKLVPPEEAQRRAAICRDCPYRTTSPGGCVTCVSLIRQANELIDRNPVKFDADEDGTVRDTCRACLCLCHIKAWIPTSVLDKAEGQNRPNYHPGCWRLEK